MTIHEVKCPACKGEGELVLTAENSTVIGEIRATCPGCKGKGTTTVNIQEEQVRP